MKYDLHVLFDISPAERTMTIIKNAAELPQGVCPINLSSIDLILIVAFFVMLFGITWYTKRTVRSVAGFLSAERCAGRYLLTMAQAMAFMSAVGGMGTMEAYYRNGFSGFWWFLMLLPVQIVLSLSGWVTYRYRETRALTMPQFLEMRYSNKFRRFAGIMAFVSGILNCGVFPAVTARFIVYYAGIPQSFLPLIMVVLIASAVTLAVSGGQITVMVTDFFCGMVANVTSIVVIFFLLYKMGWTPMMDSLMNLPALVESAPTSLVNPFNQGDLPDFGVAFFLMLAFSRIINWGIWQGNSGYLTAAKTPHEGRMANILGEWRSQGVMLMVGLLGTFAFIYLNDPAFAQAAQPAQDVITGITDTKMVSSMRCPIVISHFLPAGLMGLYLIFMMGASISTDDSAYHSWGGIFLQDIVMPIRKKPFTKTEHIKYLRLSIVGIGIFAFLFSTLFPLKEFILMWFQITASIFLGGAAAAVIGGLYWSRGTTAGAWVGMISGSSLSLLGIATTQAWKHVGFLQAIAEEPPLNGMELATWTIVISIILYVVVSLFTCKNPHNMDKLLNRSEYKVESDHGAIAKKVPFLERVLGVGLEFSLFDKIIYFGQIIWVAFWGITFVVGTVWNMAHDVSEESWRWWWGVHISILMIMIVTVAIWYTFGGGRDLFRLFRDLKNTEVQDDDDGTVI